MQKTLRRLLVLLALTAIVGTLFSASALGDELYARVRGTVTDPTGAVLPGVTLKVVNAATGAAKEMTSRADGTFEFINLTPGTYTLTAIKDGFASTTVLALVLNVNQIYVSNLTMKVGAVSQLVTVEAHAAQVEQTSIQLGGTITEAQLGTMPFLNRNWISLQQTLPGVYSSDRFGNNFATNGSQSQQNSYLVNGTDSNDIALNTPLVLPSPDSIAEVHMITNTINPEYGRNSGAVMNAISKAGTNSFHGSAFESYRDTALNVHDFFHLHPTVYHQNIFGGTVGGPVRKNKSFFFYSFQGTRYRQASSNGSGTSTVYNPATLAYGGSGNAPLSAFNSFSSCTTVPLPKACAQAMGASYVTGTSTLKTNCGATKNLPCKGRTLPFAIAGFPAGTYWMDFFNAQAAGSAPYMPSSAYNALSLNLINKFVPQPNFTNYQYTFNPVYTNRQNQHIGRFDQNIGSKDSLWFYAFASNYNAIDDLPFTGASLAGFGQKGTSSVKNFTAAWSHTFSTSILNELRFGYTRLNYVTVYPQAVVQPSDLGFANINPQNTEAAGAPLVSLSGMFTLGFSTNGPQPRKDQTYQITENFSWIKNRHAFKFGYEGRRFQYWTNFNAVNNGSYSFSNTGSYSTGSSGLDYLLGIPASYTQGTGGFVIGEAYEHYFYVQDQWRMKQNLTLTYGTGYQIDTPIAEHQFNNLGRVCYTAGQVSTIYPTAPAGYNFPGDPGCNIAGGATTKYTHFGPRLGFAYSPDWGWISGGPGKLSIRGGVGVYYNRADTEQNLQDLSQPPFGLTSGGTGDIAKTPGWPNPWVSVTGTSSIANKFPYVVPATGSNVDFSFFYPLGYGVNLTDPNRTVPYSMNFNLTIERELPGQTIVRIGYVGAQGRKQVITRNLNPMTAAGKAACLADPACLADKNYVAYDYPSYFELPGDVWGNPGIQQNGGVSNFNSLQLTVEKRLTHGLTLHSTYAWAHSLDTGSGYESSSASGLAEITGSIRQTYGDSDFDARHRFVTSFHYDLPNLNRIRGLEAIPSRIFGGWRISGIHTFQTGFPIAIYDARYRSLDCSGYASYYSCPDRPDVVFQPTPLDPHTAAFNAGVPCAAGASGCSTNYFFNPSAFTDNAFGTTGTARRGILHGPKFWNMDFSVQKETKITEGTSLNFSVDAFNVLNHTNFARPTGSFSSSNFGRVTSITGNPRLLQMGARFIF